MAGKDLFAGHKYTFNKTSGSLVLVNATDNSHEQVTFREGLIVSGTLLIDGENNPNVDMIKVSGDGFGSADHVFSLHGDGRMEILTTGESYPFWVKNDGNSSSRYGLATMCGQDSGLSYHFRMFDGNGTHQGDITSNNGTITYGQFTGVHHPVFLQSDSVTAELIPTASNDDTYKIYPLGTIVSIVKSNLVFRDDNTMVDQPIQYAVTSSNYQDKRVFGVYAGSVNDEVSQNSITKESINTHIHSVYSLGDGYILVCSQNGNIENGDYITTASGSGGYGCKQNDDILHNYTVAKSLEDVDWSTEPSSSKLIACTYHCG